MIVAGEADSDVEYYSRAGGSARAAGAGAADLTEWCALGALSENF